jgi:hypothetical protein
MSLTTKQTKTVELYLELIITEARLDELKKFKAMYGTTQSISNRLRRLNEKVDELKEALDGKSSDEFTFVIKVDEEKSSRKHEESEEFTQYFKRVIQLLER